MSDDEASDFADHWLDEQPSTRALRRCLPHPSRPRRDDAAQMRMDFDPDEARDVAADRREDRSR